MKFEFKKIYIINLSSSNQGKINSCLRENFQNSTISTINLENIDINKIEKGSLVVIPGVGSFQKSSQLIEKNFKKFSKILKNKEIFKVCICLGFQILFTDSNEGGNTNKGTNLYSGHVINFNKSNSQYLTNTGYSKIFKSDNIPFSSKDYFFNHKYHIEEGSLEKKNFISYFFSFNGKNKFLAMLFDSSINLLGFQFHPEMSGKYTLREILYNLKII